MQGLALVEADECQSCRGSLAETTAPESSDAYHVPPPVRCHRCTAIFTAQDQLAGDNKRTPHLRALLWSADLKN